MIVAGVMSGTSADGIDVAILRMLGKGLATRFSLLAHQNFPYEPPVRKTILSLMNSKSASVAELSRLNFLLGDLYAEAILETQCKNKITKIDLVGCHGQTLYHQGEAAAFLSSKARDARWGKREVACTWQSGEAAVIAARVGAPVVSDFRPADIAAKGKGAPLVPFLDYLVYRHRSRGRILQNIGGIANLSAIPGGGAADDIIAFDTGPGNMVIDGCMQQLYNKSYDRDGKLATQGSVREDLIRECLGAPFFRQPPPKTAGREQFGREFVASFIRQFGRGTDKEVIIATATALTARSIGDALKRFVFKDSSKAKFHDYIIAGGGARNLTLVRMIQDEISQWGLKLRSSEDFGVPPDAKEAIAFAVLAYQTWQRLPGNVPAATGASRPAILGKISYV
jgi:anhydro-N-acetylmuramic acid kinase